LPDSPVRPPFVFDLAKACGFSSAKRPENSRFKFDHDAAGRGRRRGGVCGKGRALHAGESNCTLKTNLNNLNRDRDCRWCFVQGFDSEGNRTGTDLRAGMNLAMEKPSNLEISDKLRGIILRDEGIQIFRQVLYQDYLRQWVHHGGLDHEFRCDEAEGDFQRTLLHLACKNGKNDFVRELLEIRANPNTTSQGLSGEFSRCTPLHLAVRHQNATCVSLLLSYTAILLNY
jgi:hypothetical protein